MNHEAKTPSAAIEKMKRFQSIDPDFISGRLTGGVYYVKENPLAHPFRRFGACYVKGEHQENIIACLPRIDGVPVIKG